jgi:uncharacterized membrane protein YfcA
MVDFRLEKGMVCLFSGLCVLIIGSIFGHMAFVLFPHTFFLVPDPVQQGGVLWL